MGYEKGRHVMRCGQNDANKIDFFDPYGPKILATRKTFTDKAVESRCITEVMKETTRHDIPYNLNEEFFETTQRLRNKLLMWRFKNYFKIQPDKVIDLGIELEPRVKQIVNSFVSLFGTNEIQIKKFGLFIKNYQEELIEERRNSFAGSVIVAIHDLIESEQTNISSKDIIDEGSLTDYENKPLKPRGLSNILKSLGFKKPNIVKVDGKAKRCIPLENIHLSGLFKRYGVTVVTVVTVTPETPKEAPVEQVEAHRNNRNLRNLVTSVTPNFRDSKQLKDILISQLTNNQEIEVQTFISQYKGYELPIEALIDQLKNDGSIFETRPGFIKLL